MSGTRKLAFLIAVTMLVAACNTTGRPVHERPAPTYVGDLGGTSPWTTCPPRDAPC